VMESLRWGANWDPIPFTLILLMCSCLVLGQGDLHEFLLFKFKGFKFISKALVFLPEIMLHLGGISPALVH